MSNKSVHLFIMFGAITSLLLLSVTNVEHVFAPTKQKLRAELHGDDEIPPVNTTADGVAKIQVKFSKTLYGVNISGISDPTGVHIHLGKQNVSGPVVFDLLDAGNSTKTTIGMHIHGKIKESGLTGPMAGMSTSDLISTMNSGDTYVDVHTMKYPNGEIRGQIKVSGNMTAATSTNATAATSTNATAATDDAGTAFINPSIP